MIRDMDKSPISFFTDKNAKLPILIVDKKGFIGGKLASLLSEKFLVVVVTAAMIPAHKNIIHVPYHRRIPIIPDHPYSHFFVVYNGESEMMDLLSSFAAKAQETSAQLLFIMSLLHSSPKMHKMLARYNSYPIHTVLYGEPFATTSLFPNAGSRLLHEAQLHERVEVANSGLDALYPIYLDDIIHGILSIAFNAGKKFELFYVFPSYPISQISFSRMIQKHAPLLKIDFKKHTSRSANYFIPSGGTYLYPNYDLGIRIGLFTFVHKEKPDVKRKKIVKVKEFDPEARSRNIAVLLTLALSLFIAPIIITLLLALSGAGLLSWSLKQAEAGNIVNSQRIATAADYSFVATESLIPGLMLPMALFPDQTGQFAQSIKTGREVIVVEQDSLMALQLLQDIASKRSNDPKDDFLKATAIMKNTLLTLQKLQAENTLPEVAQKKLVGYRGALRLAEGTIDMWPSLFGFEGKKKYLVLFQNNMELRPGGGFIGSFGMTSVMNGEFSKLEIFDVYDADGKLKTHVDPPFGLRRYMGSSHWTLRDSNFSIDFVTNAEEARKFLKMELGQDVDGVIAIDTSFLKGLLSVLGPIELRDYGERVTPDNFYLMTQTHVEKDFFPGSTQKKDFLRSLMTAMMHKLFEERAFSWNAMASMIETAVREKHLLVSSFDTAHQNAFSLNGLSSTLLDNRNSEKKNSYRDYLGVVDANVGGNKANYYVNRVMSHTVRFDTQGTLQGAVAVTYQNKSGERSPFGGEYKNYMRFILPEGAELQSVFIDGEEQALLPAITNASFFASPDFTPPSGLEVEETVGFGKSIFGFYITVPMNSKKKITVSYRIPNAMNPGDAAFLYKLYLYKQPGTISNPYSLSVAYPDGMQLVKSDKGVVDVGGKFTYETDLNTDKTITASFSKK